MRHFWMWLLVFMLAVLWGCTASSPETGNTSRSYKDIAPMKITNSGENAYTTITITSDLTGSSQQDQEVGDISTEASPVLTAAWEAAQAMGAKDGMAFMKDIAPILEKWMDIDDDHSQNVPPEPGGGDDNAGPVPDPGGGDSDGDGGDGDSDGVFDPGDYDIVGEAPCDQEMSFRDGSPGEDSPGDGVVQKKCVFAEPGVSYGESFVVQWSSGNTLDVPDSSKMRMMNKNPDTGEKDYRKYHPAEPIEGGGYVPGTPAEVYAGRGDNSTRAMLLVKKQTPPECENGDSASNRPEWKCRQVVKWEGNPNPDLENKEFSRCWWTDTTGDWKWLQRKFNFEWSGYKRNEPVLVVFDGGFEVPVSNTNKRHYPGNGMGGHVKWGVPKTNDGNPCKHYPSIAAPKDTNPTFAVLYYGRK